MTFSFYTTRAVDERKLPDVYSIISPFFYKNYQSHLEEAPCLMITGKVKWFNEIKGYGCLTAGSGRDVYVHYTSIKGDGFRTLDGGEDVEFDIIEGPKGLHAVNVRRKV